MTPTNRDELVALMAGAADVTERRAQAALDAMIKAGLAVVPVNASHDTIHAAACAAIAGEKRQPDKADMWRATVSVKAAIAAGRIDGGAA